ncbi:MAG: hypothetical protein WAU81_15080 [Candidatus Aminicenantales bacterium]
MIKEMAIRRMAYAATGLVIVVTALWAFLFVPRLAAHPQAIADGAAHSAKMFFKFQLAAAVILLVFIILNRLGGRMIRGLLYLAVIPIFMHEIMVLNGAIYYLQMYQGFRGIAVLMLACVAANLIAAVLAILAGERLRYSSFPTSRGG